MSDGLIRSYMFRRERPFTLPVAFMMHRLFAQTADKEIIRFARLRRSSNASRAQT